MNEMKEFFTLIAEYQKQGKALAAVTITASSGSVPRGAGARMLVNEHGRIFGTIGGGAIEYQVEKEALKILQEKSSCLKSYDLSESAAGLGMICGGSVTVYIQYMPADAAAAKNLTKLCLLALDLLRESCPLWLLLKLPENGEAEMGIYAPRTGYFPSTFSQLDTELHALPKRASSFVKGGCDYYAEQISSGALVHIFGGGHVARELVPILHRTGFTCAVYDDREEFLQETYFPDADKLILTSFDHPDSPLLDIPDSYFVIMTRGHQYDQSAEAFALRKPSAYIGVMGSRKKIASVSEKLMRMGFSKEDLCRIHTPIGLSIGAETPAEIAVSIAAELIQVRHCSHSLNFQLSSANKVNSSNKPEES